MTKNAQRRGQQSKPPPTIQELIRRAAKAAATAYAPYSHFAVGAALATTDGSVFTAANVENASYGLTVCAERIAAFKAVSEGQTRFAKLAIVAGEDEPAWPCGACLQVLAEFSDPALEITVTTRNPRQPMRTTRLGKLLPRAFRLRNRQDLRHK